MLFRSRSELRKLQQQLATLDPNSKEFDELSRKAGQLKDKMNDAAEATRANAGPAFAQLGNNARLLKDRFLELDFEGIGQSFNALGSSVKGLKLKDLQEGIGQAANGFVNLGKTLLANPIFLLATAIGVLIANFDKLKEAIDFGINPATRALVEETTRASEASKAAYEAFDLEERRLRALGVAESEIAEQALEEVSITHWAREDEFVHFSGPADLKLRVREEKSSNEGLPISLKNGKAKVSVKEIRDVARRAKVGNKGSVDGDVTAIMLDTGEVFLDRKSTRLNSSHRT